MALVAAGPSSAAVAALPSYNFSLPPQRCGSNGIVLGGHRRRRRIGARLAVERSSFFLGDYTVGDSSVCELESGRDDCFVADRQKGRRAQCFAGPQGRGGRGERVFFIPFGPGGGGGGGRGTFARREWERRQRSQQERLRQMVEREIQARSNWENKTKSSSSSYEFSLLRELEKRLKAEEKAGPKEGGDAKAEEPSVEEKEGTTVGSGSSTYELMKELEKRLRAERESQRGTPESPREREWSERDGSDLRMGNYASLYEYMRGWNKEMREQRARLEEQWKSRKGNRVTEETKEEERFKDQKRWQEESPKGESGRRRESGRAAERRQKHEDEKSEAAAGPKYNQSNSTVVYLKNEANGAEIYLVGTSHVSQKSVLEVKEVIERVKPDFVMLEMCRKRYENMKLNVGQDKRGPMAFVEQIVQMLTSRNVGGVGKLVGIGLASFYKLLTYRGFHPGKEFQVALEEGKKVGAKIVLGDQDIDTTLKRLGEFNLNMSMQDAFKFFGQRMPDDIAQSIGEKPTSNEDMFERMRDRKVVRRFNEEMEKGAPVIFKALLTDRNEVMVKALRNLKGKVVAVVGLAHMDGMEQLWHQANEKYLSGQSNENTVEG